MIDAAGAVINFASVLQRFIGQEGSTMATVTESASDRPIDPGGNRIVVGVDGSSLSLEALRWAQYLARPTNADIEVIAAWQVPYGWVEDGWTNDYWSPKAIADRNASDAVKSVFDQPEPNVTSTVALGSPAELLIEAGRGAAMIIVGSRGHGGFAGLLLGSVSAAVAAHAHCPVLVVHGDAVPFAGTSK